ncbi:hypothetical protein [uncultured Tenacibaculum sp.]|uniref:hypothetical protein n=1 Tax=uncultured Tenacibaculum sp. TaxID=174713 RepID=UPI00261CDFDC|nr:hypothetical protein [uncultured Tenacibaculum sp.]
MSGKRKCFLYATNLTTDSGISSQPTEVQSHIVSGPNNVTPNSNRELIVETKGTSGTATGSHVEQTIAMSSGGFITIAISCPFSSSNSYKLVENTTNFEVKAELESKHGDAKVYLLINYPAK